MRVIVSLPKELVFFSKKEANERGATFSGLVRRALIREVQFDE